MMEAMRKTHRPDPVRRNGPSFGLFRALLPRCLAVFVLALLIGMPARADGALDLKPCHASHLADEILCGTLEVLEDSTNPSGRQISLEIVVRPAKTAQPAADPIFVLAGGPGQAATDLVGPTQTMFQEALKSRDLVFVDQRGTGESNSLVCDLGDPIDSFALDEFSEEEITACRKELERRADLSLYSTYHAMPDLDQVREALGYDRINLWGGSYGTRAALVYARLFPEHTRSLVLDGTAPYEMKLPLYYARDGQRALDLLFEACSMDAGCAGAFPDPQGELEALLAELRESPHQVSEAHPRTGEPLSFTLTADAFASAIRNILYTTSRANLIPLVIRQAREGNIGPFLGLAIAAVDVAYDTMSLGMTFSVLCSEDLARIDSEEIDAAVAQTFLGRGAIDPWKEVCDAWPEADLPAGFAQLAPSNAPTLLLSGEADPVIPPRWAESAATLLPNSQHVIVPGMGHNVSHVGCVPELIADFLEQVDSGAGAVDASCVQSVKRPPFVLSFSGPEP